MTFHGVAAKAVFDAPRARHHSYSHSLSRDNRAAHDYRPDGPGSGASESTHLAHGGSQSIKCKLWRRSAISMQDFGAHP